MSAEGRFQSRDGLEFFERRWEPADVARGNLVLLHGYGEHCGRYDYTARALNEIGLSVHAYDQRGHGRSPGKRGYIRRFDLLLEDLDCYLAHVGGRLAGRPLFLMGHSMGGLVLALYAQRRKVDVRGLVFSSAFVAIPGDVSRLLIGLAGVLGRLTPWLAVARVDSKAIARDPAVVEAYEKDPLVHHGKILARTGAQLNGAIGRAHAGFEAITAPVYIIHGAEDRLVPAEGSRQLHARCRSADKTCIIYEGAYHELLNDREKDTVLADLCAWLGERL